MTWPIVGLGLLGVVCWMISTVAAGGGALAFLPVAQWLVDPRLIPPLLAIASLASSVQRCWLFRKDIALPIVAANVPGLLLGVGLGAFALRGLDARWLSLIVGLFLCVTAIRHFSGAERLHIEARPTTFAAFSFLTGAVSAVVGAAGPIMNPVYLGAGIVKQAMIGTKAASTLLMQLSKIAAFGTLGLLGREAVIAGVAVGVGTLVGNALGARLLGRISNERFGDAVHAALLLAGASMVLRQLV